MRYVRRVVKRAWESYKARGFLDFIEAVSAYLLKKYRLKRFQLSPFLKTKVIGPGRRIFYIDYFSPENSNFYWLKAFRKFGKVRIFDIVKEDRELLRERIMSFNPHHIHLGGSVKSGMVPLSLLSDVKRELGCTISVFYGDCPSSPYHSELAKVVNYIYVSNKTHVKINEEKGIKNFKYMPCPTDPSIFNEQKCKKVFDVVFIGNNNQPSRLPILRELADNFNLIIFGNGWEETGLNYGKPVYGREFSKVCSESKICIGILDPKWTELEAYFSNRLVNTLATRSFYIQRYTQGLENVFTNRKHLVWYTDESELTRLIKYYLNNKKERDKIATEGQKRIYEYYTYEKSVKRILQDTDQEQKLKLHLGSGSSHLKGYVNIDKHNQNKLDKDWQEALANPVRRKGRFSLQWYKDHPITEELLNSNVLEGKVIDLGCRIGVRAFLAAQKVKESEIIGVDASRYAIQYATNNFKLSNLRFSYADLLKLPFKDHAFDNAYMLAVIEHIADTNALLGEVKRVLKSNGKLFLSVTDRDYHSSPDHVHIFSKKFLKKILIQHDFEILDIYVKEHIIFALAKVNQIKIYNKN